jgi:hypothetical protein
MGQFNTRVIFSLIALATVSFYGGPALATETQELNGVSFPTQIEFAGKPLRLSGMALRQKKVALFTFDVYVGGLYGTANDSTRLMRMQFLRDIDAEKLKESWGESFNKYCTEACDSSEASLKTFLGLLPAVTKGVSLIYGFTSDGITVRLDDRDLGSVKDSVFAKNLLGVFVGPKADPKLKSALEGSEGAK